MLRLKQFLDLQEAYDISLDSDSDSFDTRKATVKAPIES